MSELNDTNAVGYSGAKLTSDNMNSYNQSVLIAQNTKRASDNFNSLDSSSKLAFIMFFSILGSLCFSYGIYDDISNGIHHNYKLLVLALLPSIFWFIVIGFKIRGMFKK